MLSWRGATLREGLARVFQLMPELAARRDRPVSGLPAAERRLLDIGRALMARPVLLLLLDEPCQDLEPERLAPLVGAACGWGAAVLLAERTVNAALGPV